MTYTTVEHQIGECRYHTIQDNLTPEEMARFTCGIQESNGYELGHLGHVLITGTTTVVGYIGEDRIDLVDPHNRSFHLYHNLLIDILRSSLT